MCGIMNMDFSSAAQQEAVLVSPCDEGASAAAVSSISATLESSEMQLEGFSEDYTVESLEKSRGGAAASIQAGAPGLGISLVHAPLEQLWELERLEMARQREELRGFYGDLRGLKSGECATCR